MNSLCVAFLVLLAAAPSFAFNPLSSGKWARSTLGARSRTALGVSVGGSSGVPLGNGKKQAGFLISPNTEGDEMMIIQNFNQINQGQSSKIGIIGTQSLSEQHFQMVELLVYALVLSGNHIYTSGSAGDGGDLTKLSTNKAVLYGALRACNTDLITVILPQSLTRQPPEMQSMLMRVSNLIQHPENDDLDFKEAADQCNKELLEKVDKLLLFAFHNSKTVLKTAETVADKMEVTTFYLD
jgi:hypothetical protein